MSYKSAYTGAQIDAAIAKVQAIPTSKTLVGTDSSGNIVERTQEAWTAPTFQNSWQNYGSAYTTAGYMKDSQGFVHLRGLVKGGTVGQTIFTLPVGYRPAADMMYAVIDSGALGQMRVIHDGTIYLNSGTGTYVSLDGITFQPG